MEPTTASTKPLAPAWPLSITRNAEQIGLLDTPETDIPILLRQAPTIAFLPFGLVIDQWRWKSSPAKSPEDYNKAWWTPPKYRGVAPP
jgi:peptidyl-dipeptidase A